jgi:hypothetical protein
VCRHVGVLEDLGHEWLLHVPLHAGGIGAVPAHCSRHQLHTTTVIPTWPSEQMIALAWSLPMFSLLSTQPWKASACSWSANTTCIWQWQHAQGTAQSVEEHALNLAYCALAYCAVMLCMLPLPYACHWHPACKDLLCPSTSEDSTDIAAVAYRSCCSDGPLRNSAVRDG